MTLMILTLALTASYLLTLSSQLNKYNRLTVALYYANIYYINIHYFELASKPLCFYE